MPFNVTANRLLAALPGTALRPLEPHFSPVSVSTGTVVHQVGDEMDHLYFPTGGMASLQIIMRDGRSIDTAAVGREGALGPMAGLGQYKSTVRCVVRSTLTSIKISALEFRRVAVEQPALKTLCFSYVDSLLSQTQINAARYAFLSIEARLAVCLSDASNLLASETIPFTQETLAEMIAVQRTSITEAASKLQAAGVITYSRGMIKILNPSGLLALGRARAN